MTERTGRIGRNGIGDLRIRLSQNAGLVMAIGIFTLFYIIISVIRAAFPSPC